MNILSAHYLYDFYVRFQNASIIFQYRCNKQKFNNAGTLVSVLQIRKRKLSPFESTSHKLDFHPLLLLYNWLDVALFNAFSSYNYASALLGGNSKHKYLLALLRPSLSEH